MPPRVRTYRVPCADTSRAETRPALPRPLRSSARQAFACGNRRPGDCHQRVERNRHRGPGPAGGHELDQLIALTLVLSAARADGVRATSGPDRALPEIVEPRCPAGPADF